jgi:ABC-type proline/glycine betaine transport system ATPase subunit
VALGRAIVRDPKVFLFDEPLSNLDAALRPSTRGEISALHRRLGATMICVTHDQVEAMTMGTRICIMNGGRVVQVGPPLEQPVPSLRAFSATRPRRRWATPSSRSESTASFFLILGGNDYLALRPA